MRIICIGYRNWALNIYYALKEKTNHKIKIIDSKKKYDDSLIKNFRPDLVLFYGWSWKVSEKIINEYQCIMLHPSPLPKYRGGSPIQNQIIRGETKSAVTIFIMTTKFDEGNIVGQKSFSLEGFIPDIFKRIEKIGLDLTLKFLEGDYIELKQNSNDASYFNRIEPKESELSIDEIKNKDGAYLFNKIRMLTGPYPHAFIRTKDNKRLIIKSVELTD